MHSRVLEYLLLSSCDSIIVDSCSKSIGVLVEIEDALKASPIDINDAKESI